MIQIGQASCRVCMLPSLIISQQGWKLVALRTHTKLVTVCTMSNLLASHHTDSHAEQQHQGWSPLLAGLSCRFYM